MMNIGEFAALTGLSVKALRHYDERGVLTPASVDPFSAYRKYAEDQVRTGVTLKTLRDAGMPVSEAATGSLSPDAALRAHRDTVLAKRQEEDRAYERARLIVRSLAQPITVTERAMSAQPYVAVVLSVPADGSVLVDDAESTEAVDRTNDDVIRAAEDLWRRLAADGVQPTGPLWITMRMQNKETIDLVCCLPVPHRLPSGWGGDDVELSELPERVELCAVWSQTGGDEVPEGVTHPAVVGLFDAYAGHPTASAFTDVHEVRQTATGTSADDWTVEIAVTLR